MTALAPACGLFKTTSALPDHEDSVPAGILVFFHSHSEEGPPILLLPGENARNRWQFRKGGYLIHDLGYVDTLRALKAEGYYRLREHFHPDSDQVVNKGALVQLGYDRQADPIIFFPKLHETDNSLVFPTTGMKIREPIYNLLEPLDHRGPYVPQVRHLH